ncbi:MAG: alkaline phosphatase family protein [Alphaproteobacteria bacterium]|nr:alkaline phosphatase family protein [Alphaproteobacteria bacterium]
MLTLALLAGCARSVAPEPGVAARTAPGGLVVLVVVDQLPLRLLELPKARYSGGLARLTGAEASRGVARYTHAITHTCPGHATLSTGASPAVHGIVANSWWQDGRDVYCAEPGLLRVDTVADRVVEHGGTAVALALKDRSARMLGGGATWAYYDKGTMRFTEPFGDVDLSARFVPWEPLFPEDYAAWVGPDDGPPEAGDDVTFPYPAPDGRSFLATPDAGDALADVALAAVERLELGGHGTLDLLALSFSQTDYIGHAFTTESWEAVDAMLRLDRTLGRLMDEVEARVGPVTWVLTSDHGSTEAAGAVRIPGDAVATAARDALHAIDLPGSVVFASPGLYLTSDLGDRRDEAAKAAAAAVGAVPGIATAQAWRQGVEGPFAEAILASVDPERSGDVYVMRAENALFGSRADVGTSHGTAFPHDTDVPFLLLGPRVVPGEPSWVDARRVAPTLADLLGVPAPSAATLPAAEVLR